MSSNTRRFVSVAFAIAAMVVMQPAAVRITAQATLQVVARGLVNPRGLNFGPEGALYVAEPAAAAPARASSIVTASLCATAPPVQLPGLTSAARPRRHAS